MFGCGQEGHLIRNCPEKEATGNQETEITKENKNESDQQDSGENSGKTEGQEEGKNAEQETNQMETEKENLQVTVSENTVQNTQLTNSHGKNECSGAENTDMAIDDAGFTLGRSKRKSKTGNSGPQAGKKGLVVIEKGNQVINSQQAEVKSSSDQDTNAETESDQDEQHSDGQTDLYKTDYSDNMELLDVFYRGLPKVSPEDNAALEGPLVLEELQAALNSMAGGKAPGIDGLPAEFYKFFWQELREDLLE
ncbi:hypothetical protein QTP70_018235, partial [Hemibagrus guttatus]